MKVFVFLVGVLLAGVSASPQPRQGRIIEGAIAGILDDLIADMQENGLDPISVENEKYQYRLPVTDLLSVTAHVQDVLVEGLSNIVLNNINFSILASRLRFDVSLPRISGNLGSVNGEVLFANREALGSVSGSLVITEPRVSGEARLDGISIIGIITGGDITVRSLIIDLRIQNIESNLRVQLLGGDQSAFVNNFLNYVIPGFLASFRNDINELLAYVLTNIINDILADFEL